MEMVGMLLDLALAKINVNKKLVFGEMTIKTQTSL